MSLTVAGSSDELPGRMADVLSFDDATEQILQSYRFDPTAFEGHRLLLERHSDLGPLAHLQERVEVPPRGAWQARPSAGSPEFERLAALGRAAVERGEVASVVLAGGMATRFGGVVKAGVEVFPGLTFLAAKALDAQRAASLCGGKVPLFPMTSFATDQEVRRLSSALSTAAVPIEPFAQSVSLRLERDGSLFRDPQGRPSLYAPGHGDLPAALTQTGTLDRFLARGGRVVVMSNVDNLAATLDPVIIGAHLSAKEPVSVEVTDKLPGDKGGAPASVGGRVQIVEGFRFPADFDQDQIPVFNTNTLIFDAEALSRSHPLTWFPVVKKVEGREVIQFERLVGELTAFEDTQFLRVERTGLESRFEPAKDPQELARRLPQLRALLRERGIASAAALG